MKNLWRIKHDLRCGDYEGDQWGSSMGAFFDVVNGLDVRGRFIDVRFGYHCSPMGPHDKSEYSIEAIADYSDDELEIPALFLNRLTNLLRLAGKDY